MLLQNIFIGHISPRGLEYRELDFQEFDIWRRFNSCLLKENNHESVSLTPHLVNNNSFTLDTLKSTFLAKKESQGAGRNEPSSPYLLCSKVLCGRLTGI